MSNARRCISRDSRGKQCLQQIKSDVCAGIYGNIAAPSSIQQDDVDIRHNLRVDIQARCATVGSMASYLIIGTSRLP